MTRARTLPLWLFIALIAATTACPNSTSQVVTGTPITGIRECPQAHSLDTNNVEYLLTSGTAGIPEYNDCQRFIVHGSFEALYAIYATHPKTINVGPGLAVLVAVVRSFGGTYGPLGIKPGLNCVYLSSDRQLARVVDSATYYPCCPIINLKLLPAPFLESRPTVAKGFVHDADYPQTARWDWDAKNGIQYMGVKCDSAWCEIGPTGFQRSPTWTPVATLPARMRRNMVIKGWYDEQILAGAAPSPGTLPAVSGIRGTIFPDGALADYTDASFDKTWRVIAYVAMPTKSDKYQQQMGFTVSPADPTTPLDPGKLNTIEFCAGSSTDCNLTSPPPGCPALGGSGATFWGWAKITPAGGGTPKVKCVVRWSNASMGLTVPLPASNRWRWIINDETIWSLCSAGCCEVHS